MYEYDGNIRTSYWVVNRDRNTLRCSDMIGGITTDRDEAIALLEYMMFGAREFDPQVIANFDQITQSLSIVTGRPVSYR